MRAVVFAWLAAGLVVPATAQAFVVPCAASSGVEQDGPWTIMPGPLDVGSLTNVSIDPHDPSSVVAAGDFAVRVSDDGGCTWRSGVDLQNTQNSVAPGQLGDQTPLVAAGSRPGGPMTIAAATVGVKPVYYAAGAQVLISEDDGRGFIDRTPSLLGGEEPTALRIAPSDPRTIYLMTAIAASDGYVLSSHDAGATWTRSPLLKGIGSGYKDDLAIDPTDALSVWAAQTADVFGLVHTRDGGTTWEQVPAEALPDGEAEPRSIAIDHPAGRPARLLVQSAPTSFDSATALLRSSDGGASFVAVPPEGLPRGENRGTFHRTGSFDDMWLVTTRYDDDPGSGPLAFDESRSRFVGIATPGGLDLQAGGATLGPAASHVFRDRDQATKLVRYDPAPALVMRPGSTSPQAAPEAAAFARAVVVRRSGRQLRVVLAGQARNLRIRALVRVRVIARSFVASLRGRRTVRLRRAGRATIPRRGRITIELRGLDAGGRARRTTVTLK